MRYLAFLLILQINRPTHQQRLLSDFLYVKNNEIAMPSMAKSNITQLAAMCGQQLEEHKVITEDGYILTIFRVIGGQGYPPVLLQHGLADSTDSYFLRGNTSMPNALKAAGYDVWLGSERGGRYSRKHVTLDPESDKEFWNFSFHEHGHYDFPAMIDYILAKTKKEKVAIVGHSQGNTAAYVLGSTRPEYNEKVAVMIALAPSAFLNHAKSPVKDLLEVLPFFDRILDMTGQEEILADHNLIKLTYRMACLSKLINYNVCVRGLYMAFSGQNPDEFEPEFATVVAGHYPDSLSRKSSLHYYQSFKRKRFAHYDHGRERNMELYNSIEPPDYDLSKITMKMALFYGTNDNFSAVEDVKILRDRLPNVVEIALDEDNSLALSLFQD